MGPANVKPSDGRAPDIRRDFDEFLSDLPVLTKKYERLDKKDQGKL